MQDIDKLNILNWARVLLRVRMWQLIVDDDNFASVLTQQFHGCI